MTDALTGTSTNPSPTAWTFDPERDGATEVAIWTKTLEHPRNRFGIRLYVEAPNRECRAWAWSTIWTDDPGEEDPMAHGRADDRRQAERACIAAAEAVIGGVDRDGSQAAGNATVKGAKPNA